jgi:uracil-DNA glycosylase
VPDAASPTPWPAVSQYAACRWRLARRLQDIYGQELLARCTGLNALFVRARSSTHYKAYPAAARRRIEAFCLPACRRMIEAMRPERVVVLGLGSLALLGRAGTPIATGAGGRWLACEGSIAGRPVTATLHPTGAFGLSAAEWAAIRRCLTA